MTDPVMKHVSALVLAGGEGHRLRPLTAELCKPAVPFGSSNRVIDFTLSNCVHSGLSDVSLLTQYRSDSLAAHLARHWSNASVGLRWQIRDAVDRPRRIYLGTADAVRQNLADIPAELRDVLVLAGDHVYRMDYRSMVETHRANRADVTIACVEVDRATASAFGVVSVDDRGQIRRFHEKPDAPACLPDKPERCLVSMGIYVFRRAVLESLGCAGALDFGLHVLPSLISRGRVFAHRFSDPIDPSIEYWRDIGTIDAYWRCVLDFAGNTPPFDLADDRWPISGARRAVVQRCAITRSIVACCSRIGAGARLRDSIVMDDAVVGAECDLQRVIVGPGCVLPRKTVLDGARPAVIGWRTDAGVLVLSKDDAFARVPPRRRARVVRTRVKPSAARHRATA